MIQTDPYAEIERHFACDHERQEIRIRTIKNGARVYVRQCLRCGQMNNVSRGSLTFVQRCRADNTPADEQLRDRYWQEKSDARNKAFEEAREEKNREWWD